MTETTADVIHLDDLATPRYSAEAQAIREMMATVAADFPLDADVLHERARADTGLDDFGADDYRERLELYVAGLREIDMHGPGIVNFGSQLVQWLKNRLLLTDLLKRHPEIHDIELLAPVVIAGLPGRAPHICTTCWPPPPPSAACRTGSRSNHSRCPSKWACSRIRASRGWMSPSR